MRIKCVSIKFKEYFGLLISPQVSIVLVSTTNVATHYRGNQINSQHVSTIISQIIWQMCFHLPVCTFTLVRISQKLPLVSTNYITFFLNHLFF